MAGRQIPLKDISIQDDFFGYYQKLVKEQVIPYQWNALNDAIPDAEPSHAMKNFRIAAGLEEGEYYGRVFQDSDVAKWLEAAAYSLASFPDPELEKTIDETVELIGKAQFDDGYVNTYYTLKEPDKRWTNLRDCHELYCAGHMIEAAVAYFEVTGKRRFLDIMCKYADYIDSVFGPEDGKIKGYPGHQEIELALVRLYRVTGEEKYLKLSHYFLYERGKEPFYFDEELAKRNGIHYGGSKISIHGRKYSQTHERVFDQKTAEGHSVRAAYMYTGMADLALETGDKALLDACRTLWDNIQNKRMYINGGIGSISRIEGFTGDYDLPNDTVYAETCASIALIFFAKKMLAHEKLSKYADVMERALYNLVISSMSLDGKHFFYVNPLEVNPYVIDNNVAMSHVKYVRQKWFDCACCPPNVARLLSSIGNYIYSPDENGIFVDLYIGSEAAFSHNGKDLRIKLESGMPYDGNNTLTFSCSERLDYTVSLRIPDWASKYTVTLNGKPLEAPCIENGYLRISREWNSGDKVEICFELKPIVIRSHPDLKENAYKIAVQRGPILYCMEEADNSKGLARYEIDETTLTEKKADLLGRNVVVIEAQAKKAVAANGENSLYSYDCDKTEYVPAKATMIPYYLWTNREPGEMIIWCFGKRN